MVVDQFQIPEDAPLPRTYLWMESGNQTVRGSTSKVSNPAATKQHTLQQDGDKPTGGCRPDLTPAQINLCLHGVSPLPTQRGYSPAVVLWNTLWRGSLSDRASTLPFCFECLELSTDAEDIKPTLPLVKNREHSLDLGLVSRELLLSRQEVVKGDYNGTHNMREVGSANSTTPAARSDL